MTDQIRDLLISLASHMAYMQGQLEARHEFDDPEDYYWYRESVALRQKVTDALAEGDGPVAQPVPVSERLPEAEDCDAEGMCWWWYPPVPEQNYGYWIYEDHAVPERSRLEWPDSWLPAYALPLPSGEVE